MTVSPVPRLKPLFPFTKRPLREKSEKGAIAFLLSIRPIPNNMEVTAEQKDRLIGETRTIKSRDTNVVER